MKKHRFSIPALLAVFLLVLSACGEDKQAADKAAADAKAAANPAAPKAPAKGAAKAAGKASDDDVLPALSVPPGYHYDPRGRRDPFVNPVPKPVAPVAPAASAAAVPIVRPDGLPGVLLAEVTVAGIAVSKEPGMTKVILVVRGKDPYFVTRGTVLFDAVMKEIRADEVVFTMISPVTRQPVGRETIVKVGGTSAGEKK